MTKEQLGNVILESQHQMYATAKAILKDDHDCADAIQETIVKAFAKLDTLRKDRFVKTWLMRILMNECYNICRHSEKVLPIDQYMEQIETPQKERENYGELYEAVQELREELRIPVVLYYVEDLSCREIAEMLDISKGAVQKRLARAREKLKNRLEDKEAAGR
ncbi:RNA polymerase sigma factor sigV [uncultured Clostridium sp.]|uniref:RNA polymerase sigma factor n=1 Tax=Muricoprocola aceti TaxID=2981772 RepID=A0ABT2SIZ6_9FIRM|nr:RNA polymerase sigma factor [Muricoprocola aceti]MCU6724296.1 RNA polymerase sigma factor [Muricoprocola aceti]SCH08602.1 RNA polymerase sigma factor sigV [uncultured Clostridium sp.]